MADSVSKTGRTATVIGEFTGNFLHYIRDVPTEQIIDDTDGTGIRDTDAPIFTATGRKAEIAG
jgi:hypothetical protein